MMLIPERTSKNMLTQSYYSSREDCRADLSTLEIYTYTQIHIALSKRLKLEFSVFHSSKMFVPLYIRSTAIMNRAK